MVFTDDVLAAIDQHAVESGVNLWAKQTKDRKLEQCTPCTLEAFKVCMLCYR